MQTCAVGTEERVGVLAAVFARSALAVTTAFRARAAGGAGEARDEAAAEGEHEADTHFFERGAGGGSGGEREGRKGGLERGKAICILSSASIENPDIERQKDRLRLCVYVCQCV